MAKNEKMNETGEYKIRPYKGFPGERRGEPCVHPVFSDRLLGPGLQAVKYTGEKR